MRTGTGTVQYLIGDHLGSTSLTLNNTGGLVAEIRYKAWGESRYTSGTTPTARHYTGQIEESGLGGLYFYNARWYEPGVGRFVQADTVVPEAGNPQALNRYSYTLNNPLKYTDSSGHCAVIGLDTAACVALGISAALVVTVAIMLVPPEVRHAGASAFANMVTSVVEGIRPPAHVSTLRGLTDSEQDKIDKIGRIDRLIP